MKITRPLARYFMLIVFLTVFALNTSAQKVTLSFQNETFEKVLNSIKQQTGLSLVFSEQLVNLNRKVSIAVNSIAVEEAMKQLLTGTNLGYEIKNNKLYLIENKTPELKSTVGTSKKITGLVTDEKGDPIIGASIVVKGSNSGTISDVNGKFSLDVNEQAVLTLTYIGYVSVELKVGSRNNVTVVLKEDAKALDEVVVVGYGVQNKRDISTSISQVKGDQLVDIPISDFREGMVGKMTGVQVLQPSGDPEGAVRIRVRGVSSATAGNEPLYIVDGVPIERGFANLNNNDIESVEVLKDASSAAIYGSRGSNGVIIITTKR